MTGLRIAMVGQRGVPATYGGIEHHVEQLGARLAERGHEVTVYCRSNYCSKASASHRGMRLRHLPTVNTKHLDAIAHSGLSTLAAIAQGSDVLHYHALGPGVLSPLPRYGSRSRVVQTIHGLDYDRAKWGRVSQRFLKFGGWLSARVPDATIVVSKALEEHYERHHGRASWHIPNGVMPYERRPADEIISRYGLQEGRYVLFVGRLVPEKAPDLLLRAFRRLPGDVRLVLAGGSSFTHEYARGLRELAASDPRVLLTGYVYGNTLAELYSNAGAFVLPSALEGLPLTLLEAASYGVPIIASDIPPHVEVLQRSAPGGRLFASGNESGLCGALQATLAAADAERAGAAALRERVLRTYQWSDVAEATESVYQRVLSKRQPVEATGGNVAMPLSRG